ncbi:hypothetical protein G6F42_025363 [Rhizopus arrhizus]|nr:hypothetical protein G6F42_025363 [Rhizopus arrhizus]
MKFAKYLESESIPEWRKAYINYKGLKKRLKAIEKYRKLNHVEENVRLQNAIQDIDDAPDVDYPNRIAPRRPTRTQSSIIDNRSSGLQPRNKTRN